MRVEAAAKIIVPVDWSPVPRDDGILDLVIHSRRKDIALQ